MKLTDAGMLAFSTLRSARMRTFLTLLGLSVGVAAVLTVLSLGHAGEVRVEQEIATLGVDKVWVRPKNERFHIHESDGIIVQRASGAPACAAAYCVDYILWRHAETTAQVAGFDQQMEEVHSPKLLSGRIFCSDDFQQGSSVCLVDESLAEAFGAQLLGEWITLHNRMFRVVGIIEAFAPQTSSAGTGMVILPLRTYLDTFGGRISEITLSVQNGQRTEHVAQQALDSLGQEAGFRADTLAKEIGAAREIVRIFVMVLACVAAVCMLTGAIGVANVLLISVRERQKEIGLIKAIGGTSWNLGCLFLLEALIYALFGDLLGTFLGSALIHLFSAWISLEAELQLGTLLPVLLAAAALGLCAGVAPAVKAAKLQPIDALKCE